MVGDSILISVNTDIITYRDSILISETVSSCDCDSIFIDVDVPF
jgi:hypothetical protein